MTDAADVAEIEGAEPVITGQIRFVRQAVRTLNEQFGPTTLRSDLTKRSDNLVISEWLFAEWSFEVAPFV